MDAKAIGQTIGAGIVYHRTIGQAQVTAGMHRCSGEIDEQVAQSWLKSARQRNCAADRHCAARASVLHKGIDLSPSGGTDVTHVDRANATGETDRPWGGLSHVNGNIDGIDKGIGAQRTRIDRTGSWIEDQTTAGITGCQCERPVARIGVITREAR